MEYGQSKIEKKIRSFTDLIAWQEGHKLVLEIYDIVSRFPSTERFGLRDQLCRAAVSVTSNIAEGFRRRTAKEKRNFYSISLASLTEIQNQLLIARDVKYLEIKRFQSAAELSTREQADCRFEKRSSRREIEFFILHSIFHILPLQ